ncbi:fasciclin domain-containing protein [Methanococcoides sp. LMO-2]|uniref:Fasciclin domain-containing protein n=1 Tax=Methanococcoides cohabitans TaxID=3136559 RepID=A0ABU9KTK3_9EURY
MKYKSTIWLLTFLAVIFSLTATASAGTVVDIINDSENHTILETALSDTGLTVPLSAEDTNFTVFAPTDAAFAALPPGLLASLSEEELTNILLYHALDGRVLSTDLSDGMTATTLLEKDVLVTIDGTDVFINNAQVTVVDIEADNGVVHVIDAVLVPPATVVDIISNSPRHTTLEAALIAANLNGTLSGPGNFTVFAPTDDAFDALPPGLLASLSEEELTNILLYHVLDGRVLSTDLSDGMTATTLLGKNILVTINEDGVFINDAKVTVVDLEADNGVVHVIDAVLVPPNIKADIIALKSQVDSEDLNRPIDRALQAKLDAALKSESKGNEKAAANQLNAFINSVEAQSGKAIDEVVAGEWISLAEMIISDLES